MRHGGVYPLRWRGFCPAHEPWLGLSARPICARSLLLIDARGYHASGRRFDQLAQVLCDRGEQKLVPAPNGLRNRRRLA